MLAISFFVDDYTFPLCDIFFQLAPPKYNLAPLSDKTNWGKKKKKKLFVLGDIQKHKKRIFVFQFSMLEKKSNFYW